MNSFILLVCVLCVRASAKQVHVVFGNHLDIGFDNIEPYVGYDNNVLNMYFNRYLPLAVDISDYMARVSPGKDRYIYTTHSYVISLFLECPTNMGLDCPSAATKAKVLRGIQTGAITWHAHPHNAQYEFYDPSLLDFSFQLTHTLDKRFGFKPKHTAILRDVPGLTRAAIPVLVKSGIKAISVGVNGGSAPPGVPHYTPFIWKDEASNTEILAFWHPGGYGGLRPGNVFIDPPDQCIQAQGLDHVLCTAWRNDNEGPPLTVLEPLRVYQLLRQEWTPATNTDIYSSSSSSSTIYPQSVSPVPLEHTTDSRSLNLSSNVFASSFDAFVDAVLDAVSSRGLKLPVVTSEIGDTWIFGVQSDPVKTANFRAISRARAACVANPQCPSESSSFFEFSRLLLKVPEHTWGVDIKKTLHDFTNYSNTDFHQCITPIQRPPMLQQQQDDAQQRQLSVITASRSSKPSVTAARAASSGSAYGLSSSSSSDDGVPMREFACPNYQHCIHSWDRQAAYIDWAVKALPPDHPVVQAYSADVTARKQAADISHEQLLQAGATVHNTAAAAAAPVQLEHGADDDVASASSSSSSGEPEPASTVRSRQQDQTATAGVLTTRIARSVLSSEQQQPGRRLQQQRSGRQQQQRSGRRQQHGSRSAEREYTCGSWRFTLDETKGGLTSLRKLYGTDRYQPGVDWAQGNKPSSSSGSSSRSDSSSSSGSRSRALHTPPAGLAAPDLRLQDGCQLNSTRSAAAAAAGGGSGGAATATTAAAAAAAAGVLGQLRYSAYCESSYDFVWQYYAYQQPLSWWFPLDFGKVNSSAAWNKEVHVMAELQQVYETFTPSGGLQQLSLRSTFPAELVENVGAPPVMWTIITCPQASSSSSSSATPNPSSSSSSTNVNLEDAGDDGDLQVAVVWQNKTPTRLPEALWFSFVPDPGAIDVDSWRMHKLGSWISPREVILNGSQSMHAVSEAGIQVQSADRSELLQIKTLDTALVSPGHPNPFPNGAFAPCMQEGMHFNLMNNIWGTNYIMWVPYGSEDVNMAFRFHVHAEKVQKPAEQQKQQEEEQLREHTDRQQRQYSTIVL